MQTDHKRNHHKSTTAADEPARTALAPDPSDAAIPPDQSSAKKSSGLKCIAKQVIDIMKTRPFMSYP